MNGQTTEIRPHGTKAGRTVCLICIYIILILLTLSMLFPYVYMMLTTFKSNEEALSAGLNLFPSEFRGDAYAKVWTLIPFAQGILNTMLVEVPVVLVGTFTSGLAAYSFAKMKLPLARMWLLILMSSMMVPYAALFLPQYQIYNSLNMTNTLWPLILPGLFGNVSMIFFFVQFMGGIPNALFEAAKIDGCGQFKCFLYIMLPLLWPAMAAQGVFWFLGIWNDYFAPSIYLTQESVMTLQPLINSLNSSQRGSNFPVIMTGAFLSSVPLLVVYLIFQKYFIRAVSITSGIK